MWTTTAAISSSLPLPPKAATISISSSTGTTRAKTPSISSIKDEDGQTEETPAVCNCTDKCEAGAVNTACPVCSVNLGDCTGKEAEPEEPEQPEEETQGNIGGILLIVLILAGGGGAAFYCFKVLKPKKDAAKGNDNLDEYDFDDYDEDEEADGELPDGAAADEQEDETV